MNTSGVHFLRGQFSGGLTIGTAQTREIPQENINEALFLFVTATIGLFFNIVIVICILGCKPLRRMTSAFLLHGCILDILKCVYCVPFGNSLLHDVQPEFCTWLGGSYVVIVTASGFNIVAMICSEAYSFSEHRVGTPAHGSLCCVIFGVLMVYVGSIIIHLGPTIIGGDFNYNNKIGNCIFVYGTIKSYVVHSMWIVIMTLAMIGATYYLVIFYRHIRSNSRHRLATLARGTIAISRGDTGSQESVQKVIRMSLSRARVLMTITALFVLCWYPLFLLTLFDPRFTAPTRVYKLLTFVAWSNAALNPIVFILFDRKVLSRLRCPTNNCCTVPALRDEIQLEAAAPQLPAVYQRVGCRLCHEGHQHVNVQCNGGLVRDSSLCDLHGFDSAY